MMLDRYALKASASAWSLDFLSRLVSGLPSRRRRSVARWLGRIYSQVPHTQRQGLEKNLKLLHGAQGPTLKVMTTKTFENYAVTLHDFFFPDGLNTVFPDKDKLEKLHREKGGVLLLTFHMGNWELGAHLIKEGGWPMTAIYQPYQNKKFKEIIAQKRAKGVNFIPVGSGAALGVRDALRKGDIVAMLGDLPFGEEGMDVNLAQYRVKWPKGPVLLAVREKAPIVISVMVRTLPSTYQLVLSDPIFPQSGSRAEVERIVQEVAHKFAKLASRFPTQWYRFEPLEVVTKAGV